MAATRLLLTCVFFLLPTASFCSSTATLSDTEPEEIQNIQSAFDGIDELSKVYTYLNSTGVIYLLANQTAATFLAPSNAAFAELPSNVRDRLTGPEGNTVLINLLKFHIIPQYRASEDFQGTAAGTALPTLLGSDAVLYFTAVDGLNFFYTDPTAPGTNATDIGPDTLADDVISIQEIDRVLFPTDLALLLPPAGHHPPGHGHQPPGHGHHLPGQGHHGPGIGHHHGE